MYWVSARDAGLKVPFVEALVRGVAPGGLPWAPDMPAPFKDVPDLLAGSPANLRIEVLNRLMGDTFGPGEVASMAGEALDYGRPLVKLSPRLWAFELFHGPTGSWADAGARLLAQAVALLRWKSGETRNRTVIATGGADLVAAVVAAFQGVPGVRVMALYPEGGVTPWQERAIAGGGPHVRALAVEGTWEACGALALTALQSVSPEEAAENVFVDPLHPMFLLAQLLMTFEAAHQVKAQFMHDPVVMAVSCGNGVTLDAGLRAAELGLPVKAWVAALPDHHTFADALASGTYVPHDAPVSLTPALDVAEPLAWPRLLTLFGGDARRLRQGIRWGAATDKDIRAALWELAGQGYLADPQSALSYSVLRSRLALAEPGVCFAPLHPSRAKELLETTMGRKVPMSPHLAAVMERKLAREALPPDPLLLASLLSS